MVSVAVLAIPWLLSTQGVDANITHTVAGTKIFRDDIVPLIETEVATENVADTVAEVAAETVAAVVVAAETVAAVVAAAENVAETAAELAAGDAVVKPVEKSPEPAQPALAAVKNTTPALLDASTSTEQVRKPSVPATSSTGWAVRVGTFSKQANADSVSTLLAGNGFTAHKTTVQTALGDNATRIWLGPYAKKETAGEISLRLLVLIGEKGFVTKHLP